MKKCCKANKSVTFVPKYNVEQISWYYSQKIISRKPDKEEELK